MSLSTHKSKRSTEWIAYKKVEEVEQIVGKINVQSYEPKIDYTLYIYAVNGQSLPEANAIQTYLNNIYGQALINWTVKIKTDLKYSGWDTETADTKIQVSGSDELKAYTKEQKNIIKYFRDQHDKPKGNEFVLFWSPEASESGAKGFMPLSKRYGFIFSPKNNDATYRTVAHELGHGAFALRHTWKVFDNITKGDSKNLMDYDGGLEIWKWQWDLIQNPAPMVGFENEDEDGQHYSQSGLFKNFDFGQNSDNTFSFMTPSKQVIVLPSNVSDVSFFYGYYGSSNADFKKIIDVVPGCIRSFTIGDKSFEIMMEYGENSTQITGYYSSNEDGLEFYESEKYIDQFSYSTDIHALPIVMSFARKGNILGYYGLKVNNTSLKEIHKDAVLIPLKTFDITFGNTYKAFEYTSNSSQYSMTPELLSKYLENNQEGEILLLLNKIAELDVLYPIRLKELTQNEFLDWSQSKLKETKYNPDTFEGWIQDKYFDIEAKRKGYNITLKEGFSYPTKKRDLLLEYLGFLETHLFDLVDNLEDKLIALNDIEFIKKTSASEIVQIVNLSNKSDIENLTSESILNVISKICNVYIHDTGELNRNNGEEAILKLLKEFNLVSLPEVYKGLEGENKLDPTKYLFEQLYTGIDDEVMFIGEDNRKELVSIMTSRMILEKSFYEEKTASFITHFYERLYILQYNNILIRSLKFSAYIGSYIVVDDMLRPYIVNELKTHDIDYEWDSENKKIKYKQDEQVGFYSIGKGEYKPMSPFDLVVFINLSNLSGIKDITEKPQFTNIPLPSFVLMYGSDKATKETIEQTITTVADISGLVISGGTYGAIRGGASMMKIRRTLSIMDMASSGLSLAATAVSDQEENKNIRNTLTALSTVTGIFSMTEIGFDKYAQIKNAKKLQGGLKLAESIVGDAGTLPTKVEVNKIFETITDMTDTEVKLFVENYPKQVDTILGLGIKRIKSAAKTGDKLSISLTKNAIQKLFNVSDVVDYPILAKYNEKLVELKNVTIKPELITPKLRYREGDFYRFEVNSSNIKFFTEGGSEVNNTVINYVINEAGEIKFGVSHSELSRIDGKGDMKPVLGAGAFLVHDGEIVAISNLSGHYQPSMAQGLESFKYLEDELGIDLSKTYDHRIDFSKDWDNDYDQLMKSWEDQVDQWGGIIRSLDSIEDFPNLSSWIKTLDRSNPQQKKILENIEGLSTELKTVLNKDLEDASLKTILQNNPETGIESWKIVRKHYPDAQLCHSIN